MQNAEFIEAANGKCLPAVDVYAMALKFLKETALEWIHKLPKHPYQKIQWIVTVPAIWSDAAKETMRKAAMKVNSIAAHVNIILTSFYLLSLYIAILYNAKL